jgi:hypothetical protein
VLQPRGHVAERIGLVGAPAPEHDVAYGHQLDSLLAPGQRLSIA